MTQNFRKTLMATTMLAGLAIFALDTAQAGPNGGPSLGSISGFSSMRMDFNRIGGPGRALSRDDMRVVPLEVKKTIPSGIMPLPGKKDDKKDIAKKDIAKKDKGTNVARVSNSKSASGGKGKEDVGNTPEIHIPAAIADIFHLTGGNIGDLSKFDEYVERLGLGPLVVNVPFLPGNDGSFNSPVDQPDTEQHRFDPNSLLTWYASAPGGPDTSKTGWAAGDPWRRVGMRSDGTHTWTHDYHKETDTHWYRDVWQTENSTTARDRLVGPNIAEERWTRTVWDEDGNEVVPEEPSEKEDAPKEEAEKKDSQPAPEGYGRPTNGGGWCSPTGGCYRPARNAGPRIIPTETQGSGTISAHRQSPTWATDPSEEGYTGGGTGGGYTGYRPQDEEGGDIGGPGNPALDGLIAAI